MDFHDFKEMTWRKKGLIIAQTPLCVTPGACSPDSNWPPYSYFGSGRLDFPFSVEKTDSRLNSYVEVPRRPL